MPNIPNHGAADSGATAARLVAVRAQVADLARRYGRDPASVLVLAVSKTKPAAAVAAAYAAGQRDFGENFLQDALGKLDCVPMDTNWHFIGAVQSNKTRAIAERFAWVHTIERMRIARRLSDQRPTDSAPLSVCVQVNISGEDSKAGVGEDEALDLAQEIAALPRMRLRGFMAIPHPASSLAEQRVPFTRLRELLRRAQRAGLTLDTLSMGMSDDMEAAIAEGATIVRIGTAIFGPRDPPAAAADGLPHATHTQ